MDMLISSGKLGGDVVPPSSKSASHRAIICAALAGGESELSAISLNDDILATMSAMRALGAKCVQYQDKWHVGGISSIPPSAVADCAESGSTLRFLVPIAAALGISASFTGKGRLPERPMTELTDVLLAHGINISKRENEILSISGQLQSGEFIIRGDVSSQYITGLLFALPLLSGDSVIRLSTPMQSIGYVDMTVQMLAYFGIKINAVENGWHIVGGQTYKPCRMAVEADYSGAAFWLAAGAIGNVVKVYGLSPDSLQGDREIIPLLLRFGATVEECGEYVSVSGGNLHGITINAGDIPDLVPVLAVLGAYADGETVIENASRLRLKESDRLTTVTEGLALLGADISEYPDKLIIRGKPNLGGGVVDSFGDHRIAMAMSIAAAGCTGDVTVKNAQCVTKSYPDFYKDFAALGGICNVV